MVGLALAGTLAAAACTPPVDRYPPLGRAAVGAPGIGVPDIGSAATRPHRTAFGSGAPPAALDYLGADGRALPGALGVYLEITVGRTEPWTAFTTIGFAHGSYGLREYQAAGAAQRYLVFSVHDPVRGTVPSADEHAAVSDAAPFVQVLPGGRGRSGPAVRMPLDWRPGRTYRLLLVARVTGNRIGYTPFVFAPPPGDSRPSWLRLATVSRVTTEPGIGRPGSLVEDLRRTADSGGLRQADLADGWLYTADHRWLPLATARPRALPRRPNGVAPAARTVPGGFGLSTGGPADVPALAADPQPDVLTATPNGGPPADVRALVEGP